MMQYIGKNSGRYSRGFSLIEMLVGIAIFAVLILSIAEMFRFAVHLVVLNKAKAGAISLVNERMEFIRNLSYSAVGTDGGIPSGTIEQVEVVDLNGISYTLDTFVQYVDNPADGTSTADINGITADYKVAKVTADWTVKGRAYSVMLVSNIAPKGIESISGGGTLRLNVFDAAGLPISAASVLIENASTSPPVSVNTQTNASGIVLFPGSPSGAGYEITVSKAGMSTAKTYDSDATNVSPTPGHLTIATSTVTTASFQIDNLASYTIETYLMFANTSWQDLFDDSSKISTSSSVTVSGGDGELTQSSGVYASSGSLTSIAISPEFLQAWGEFSWTDTTTATTSILYKVYYRDSSGNYTLVPDGALSGNSTGFDVSPVSLSGIDVDTYRDLQIQALLSTTDTTETPTLSDWAVSYTGGPVSTGNIAFSTHGQKTIGTDASGNAIYKFSTTTSTDSSGSRSFPSIEWDSYTTTLAGSSDTAYDIGQSCALQPVSVSPGSSVTTGIVLSADTAHNLLVFVADSSGNPLPDSTVRLYDGGGYDVTKTTTSCGQAFFPSLSKITYGVDVSHSGYSPQTNSNVIVDGDSLIQISL